MPPTRRGSAIRTAFAALLSVALLLLPGGDALQSSAETLELPHGQLAGSLGRHLATLDLDVPRPRVFHSVESPHYVGDLALHPTATLLTIVVAAPHGPTGDWGNDLLTLDLTASAESPLLNRDGPGESFDHPHWWPDGSVLIYQRNDLTQPPSTFLGAPEVYYPSRVEMVTPGDPPSRVVLVDDARHPAPSPDGRELAYVRGDGTTAALLAYSTIDGSERELIGYGQFTDIAYPRFSPDGMTIAFLTADASQGLPIALDGSRAPAHHRSPSPTFRSPGAPDSRHSIRSDHYLAPIQALFRPAVSRAHGFPWSLWLMNADTADLRQVDQVQADEGTLSWAPAGTHLFVHGGAGSYLVHAPTSSAWSIPHIAGYGATVWLPEE